MGSVLAQATTRTQGSRNIARLFTFKTCPRLCKPLENLAIAVNLPIFYLFLDITSFTMAANYQEYKPFENKIHILSSFSYSTAARKYRLKTFELHFQVNLIAKKMH